jgi:hypothetical protein
MAAFQDRLSPSIAPFSMAISPLGARHLAAQVTTVDIQFEGAILRAHWCVDGGIPSAVCAHI